MKVLAVGDIVGEAGVRKLKGILPDLKKRDEIDFDGNQMEKMQQVEWD